MNVHVKVRRYAPTDWPEVYGWGKAWGEEYAEDLFPKTGFIVPGVAAYFLYATDSKVCYLENMISNPRSSDRDREQALSLLVTVILAEAKVQGYRVAYACTNVPKVIERAVRSGAEVKSKYALIIKELGQPIPAA